MYVSVSVGTFLIIQSATRKIRKAKEKCEKNSMLELYQKTDKNCYLESKNKLKVLKYGNTEQNTVSNKSFRPLTNYTILM